MGGTSTSQGDGRKWDETNRKIVSAPFCALWNANGATYRVGDATSVEN